MNKEKEEKNEDKKQNKDREADAEYIKITISRKAEDGIANLVAKVNDGFAGGRVTRQDIASWVLSRFTDECTEQDIKAIRTDHFDEITLLELSLKRYKQGGTLPPELRKLLLAQAGLDDAPKKQAKIKLTTNFINDEVKKDVA